MNSARPIGGYFELELPAGSFPYKDAILLNSGRNCFEYILRANNVQHVYMPKYTCSVMFTPLKKLNIAYTLYEVNEQLEIKGNVKLQDNDYIVYTNYFGVKDTYCRRLSDTYGDQLILDCSQAFYFEPLERGHTFYSPRKLFGLPDGGILVTNKKLDESLEVDQSYQRFNHLLKRIDLGAEAGYKDFKSDDASLIGQPIRSMSLLTQRLMQNIDYEAVKQERLQNFGLLQERLGSSNRLQINLDETICPMVYPYFKPGSDLRQKLIDQKIFIATYWPEVLDLTNEQDAEYELVQKLLPLPVDQRYGQSDMERIAEVIDGRNN